MCTINQLMARTILMHPLPLVYCASELSPLNKPHISFLSGIHNPRYRALRAQRSRTASLFPASQNRLRSCIGCLNPQYDKRRVRAMPVWRPGGWPHALEECGWCRGRDNN